MKMNKLAIAVSAALMGLSTVAQAELSANIGATSNYVWRGVTQTGNDAAISGGVDYSHESGFYVGTWASNTNFNSAEWDIYGGFAGEFGDGFGYDIGMNYYTYPDIANANFAEALASVSFGPVTAGLAYTFASDVTETAAGNELFIEGDMYYYLSAGTELSDGWSIAGTVGYYDFEDDGVAATATSYGHGQLDLTKSAGDYGDFTFSVSVAEKESGDDDPKVFVSWAKSF